MTKFDHDSIPEFSKDKRKLKIRSLERDLERFEKAFSVDKTGLTGIVRISRLHRKGVKTPIYKARKVRCKGLGKGARSGLRIVFAYYNNVDLLVYVEIYHKNKQSNHDENRIIRHFKEK